MSIKSLAAVLLWALPMPSMAGSQAKFAALHEFAGSPDGATPLCNLIFVGGARYGTTQAGGRTGAGAVFKLNPKTGAETILYSFGKSPDGADPYAGLVYHAGYLYGTTIGGGSVGQGTVFKVNIKTGAEAVVHSFSGGTDGASPQGVPIYQAGYLYGTTYGGGSAGNGTVYKVNISTGAESVIHSFTGGLSGGGGTSDGGLPEAGLTAANGVLYGTTEYGGTSSHGTIFEIDPASSHESVVYSFSGGADGDKPTAGLILTSGNLYGTTSSGGSSNYGAAFKFDPASETESVVYSFTGYLGDGGQPLAALTFNKNVLYGTTAAGGTYGYGTIYEISLVSGLETVLYSFSAGNDGSYPSEPLLYQGGVLYGTVPYAGSLGNGLAFKLSL